jgi:hypothetical protein
MLNTFIKNRGATKTIIHNNNKNKVNEIKWDADYDGDVANISLDLTNNGNVNHLNLKLDNDDLANILNISSVKTPIHRRLAKDFKKVHFHKDPSMYNIYLDDFRSPALQPIQKHHIIMDKSPTLEQLAINMGEEEPTIFTDKILKKIKPNTHISSPLPNEELIIPLTIDEKDTISPFIFTGNTKRRIRPKTHKVYHIYNNNNTGKRLHRTRNRRRFRNKTYRKDFYKYI